MRLLVLLFALTVHAEEFSFTPATIHQGETLKLHGSSDAAKARFDGTTIPLFVETDGSTSGLMPVGVEMEPGDYRLEFLNSTGEVIHMMMIAIHDAHYPKQNIVISEALSGLRATSDEAETVRAFLKSTSPARYWEEPFHLPVGGCMNSPFGASRLHNGKPTGDYHGGVDQRAAMGSPIRAATAGTVRIVRMFTLRGGTVAIDHGQGLETIYMHMSRFSAREGQEVKAGDVIGYAGATGRATGPHLHWSVYANGHSVSPYQWVKLTPCSAVAARRKVQTKAKKK